MERRSYKAKILLFGEYTIIFGAHALAIPIPQFEGYWDYVTGPDTESKQGKLKAFGKNLDQLQKEGKLLCKLDSEAFLKELEKGLYFNSNIPQGYGAGSSGALCAAVYDWFSSEKIEYTDHKTLLSLKKQLAQLEQFFHGSSSGIDPLVSYLDQAVEVTPDKIQLMKHPVSGRGKNALFLLNTGIARKTAPLVNLFLEKCKEEEYKTQCQDVLGPLNEAAIQAFSNQDPEKLSYILKNISEFQYRYFKEMIPEPFKNLWQKGLESDLFKLKLCGAGGGGFIIGMTNNFESLQDEIPNYELITIYRF